MVRLQIGKTYKFRIVLRRMIWPQSMRSIRK